MVLMCIRAVIGPNLLIPDGYGFPVIGPIRIEVISGDPVIGGEGNFYLRNGLIFIQEGRAYGKKVLISASKKNRMLFSSSFSPRRCLTIIFVLVCIGTYAQPGADALKWNKDGNSFYKVDNGEIIRVDLPGNKETVVVGAALLTPAGQSKPLDVENFSFSEDGKKLLIYTNSKKVWRYNTRGDYWVLDSASKKLETARDRIVPNHPPR